jgi:hypothetical protein
MRRVLPWALLSLLVLAGLGGAGFGMATQPSKSSASPEVSKILAATRAAGTARFSYSSVMSSANPLLRAVFMGKGSVDFHAAAMRSTQSITSTGVSITGDAAPRRKIQTSLSGEIWINDHYYIQLPLPFGAMQWIESGLPVASSGAFGVIENLGSLSDLFTEIEMPGATIQNLGPQTLSGIPTTQYLLTPSCSEEKEAVGVRESIGPVHLWVDDMGRLTRASGVISTRILRRTYPNSALSRYQPIGDSITRSTLRLSGFGTAVLVRAPKSTVSSAGHASASAFRSEPSCVS